MTRTETLYWNDRAILTNGDLVEVVASVKTPEEAQAFLAAYRKLEPKHADSNIGYLCGYLRREDADRLLSWFDVSHPIFGKAMPKDNGETALAMGRAIGEQARRKLAPKAREQR